MVFDVRCIVLRLSFGKYFVLNTFGDIKLSECSSSSVLGNYRSKAATATSDRSQRASDATRSHLSSVTKAIDNDVCVHRFVKFARQKSFSG